MSGQDATPAAEPSGRPAKRKCVGFVAAGVAVVVLLAGGGWAGRSAYEHHRLESARAACADASESLRVAMNGYNTLRDGRAADAKALTAKQVADAKTVDTLADALDAAEPGTAACVADSRADYETQTDKVDANRAWYVRHKASLAKAVKAVEKSRDAKIIADGAKLLKDSKGKVADERTRTALDKAIKAKDALAVAKAVKAVNDSMKAKQKADAQAKAKAEAEAEAQAQAAAAAAAQAAQTQQSWSPSGSGYTGNGYSTGGYSGSGYSSSNSGYSSGSTPSTSTPSQSTGSASSDSSYDITKDPFFNQHTTNESCASGNFCPIG